MTFPAYSDSREAVSGVAFIELIPYKGDYLQVACQDVTGSGTVTITVKPANCDEYQSVEDGEIDLSDPIAVRITGHVDAIKCTSSNTGDAFTMVIGA